MEGQQLTNQRMLVMALALCKIQVSERMAHLILMLNKGIEDKKENFSIRDIAEIQTAIDNFYKNDQEQP